MSFHQLCPIPDFPRFRPLSDAEERSMADAVAEQAAQVEATAEAVRARMEPADLSDVVMDDEAVRLLQMIRAGQMQEAGAEFVRLIEAHCTEVGEYEAGVK